MLIKLGCICLTDSRQYKVLFYLVKFDATLHISVTMAGPNDGETAITRNDAAEKVPMPHVGTQPYATRKTVAQGMMDLALMSSNVAQFVIVYNSMTRDRDKVDQDKKKYTDETYFLLMMLIGASMALQITVGVVILVLGSMNVKSQRDHDRAQSMNNAIVGIILFITIVNVFIGVFITVPG